MKKDNLIFITFNEEVTKQMYIGGVLKERMDCFNISTEHLSEISLVKLEEIEGILNDEISLGDIDEISLNFISQSLYCAPDYFINSDIRESDVIHSSLNRGDATAKSNEIKGKLQMFCDDLSFLMEIKDEI